MRSDKCKKVGFDSFFVIFVAYASLLQWVVKIGARLCQSSAIVVHSWGISFSILAHFTQCCGSLEASRGGMLEVIGAVGSRSGLCWRLCCCYVTCFAAMLVHLAVFFSAVWLRHVLFFVARVKHFKNTEKMRSDKCKKSGFDSFLCRFCCFVLWKLAPVGGQIRGTFVPIFGDLGAFLVHILFHIGALQRMLGSLEASRGGMLEVIGAVGSRSGLCWRLCCCFGPLVCSLTWAGGFLRSPCETQKNEKCGPTSVRKVVLRVFWSFFVAYESLLQWAVKFGACLWKSLGILVHSWDISFSILEHSTQCWGSLGASRGGMLEVIGAVGSRAMLKALLLLRYLFCSHVGPLGCFISAVWLGQVVFCVVCVKHYI